MHCVSLADWVVVAFGRAVNMPEVELGPAAKDTHRLLHFHDNVPGVLAAINTCVGDAECNVKAQHLKTNERHGYVILDVERKVGSALCSRESSDCDQFS